MDHPRSRGVYRTTGRGRPAAEGSSPLARGLRSSNTWIPLERRIIPARAGFTTSPSTTSRRRRDHPRSRGVYSSVVALTLRGVGSSPLARGLRHDGRRQRGGDGIIPARAGFTRGPPGPRPRSEDHPRSRGVYPLADPLGGDPAGSSPLARGLHPLIGQGGSHIRIIPARAGFTSATGPDDSA